MVFRVTTNRLKFFSDISASRVAVLYNLPLKRDDISDIYYIAEAEVLEQVGFVDDALREIGVRPKTFGIKNEIHSIVKALKSYKPEVAINLSEGTFGNSQLEMSVPALLELLRIPYTGSPPLTLGLCQNKGLAKDVLKSRGIPTPKWQVLRSFRDWKGEIKYPLIVKPSQEDASLGITKKSFVKNRNELEKRVMYINRRYRQPALVEMYINGRELNVAILGNEKPKILPVSEIMFKTSVEPKIVDYLAKWVKDSDEYKNTIPVCPAKLKPVVKRIVEKVAMEAYKALNCRDYARIDIRLRGDTPYVLEVNPNPDISPDAGFTRSLKAARISFRAFLKRILSFAIVRKAREPSGLTLPLAK